MSRKVHLNRVSNNIFNCKVFFIEQYTNYFIHIFNNIVKKLKHSAEYLYEV